MVVVERSVTPELGVTLWSTLLSQSPPTLSSVTLEHLSLPILSPLCSHPPRDVTSHYVPQL